MSRYVEQMVRKARAASFNLARLSTVRKNKALQNMGRALTAEKDFILRENKKDLKKAIKNKMKQSFIDRLTLDTKRIEEMSLSLREVAGLKDPVGDILSTAKRPNGIKIQKIRVPVGVVLIVYEARPNVTSDCAGLLFKTSNVGILRGGSDAFYSNRAVGKVLAQALRKSGIDFSPFFVVEKLDHKTVDELLKQEAYIDLVIPRGGEALIRKVVESSRIPVIKHYKGICHIFVDKTADIPKALKICINAKVQRPSVCNAVETILIHKSIARRFLPQLKKAFDSYGVAMRGDREVLKIIPDTEKAKDKDWETEYLDLIISLKVVESVEAAITHINTYGSHHTESIITKDTANARKFVKEVDSACCFINISTRFSDGYQFGLGAEIGISTDKLHARGPMGLKELTTYKWIARGNGQIRQ